MRGAGCNRPGRSIPMAVVAALLVSACTPMQPTPPASTVPSPPPFHSGECNTASAQFTLGRHADAALQAEARTRTGAKVVRVLRPGQAVTMEFNAQRLNLEVDGGNRVLAARCG